MNRKHELSELNDREKDILEYLILQYIDTAQPVSSRTLKKRFDLDISPATIRNVLSDLEEDGLLTQPHISAGRIPTDKGYRLYLNALMRFQQLTITEIKKIETEFTQMKHELSEVLVTASHTLTLLTGKIGLVLDVHLEKILIDHLELIKVYKKKIVIILVLQSGMVFNETIELPFDITKRDLSKIKNLLNKLLSGKDIRDASHLLTEKIEKIEEEEKLLGDLLRIFNVDFSRISRTAEKLYISNSETMFNEPEISDLNHFKNMIRYISEENPLKEILSKLINSEGISVLIGNEIGIQDLNDFSIISSPFNIKNQKIGVLGVIGPKRMQYSRVISLVDFISNHLTNTINKIYQGDL